MDGTGFPLLFPFVLILLIRIVSHVVNFSWEMRFLRSLGSWADCLNAYFQMIFMQDGIATDLECHCRHNHCFCMELAKRHGCCPCDQFVILVCPPDLEVFADTWVNVLASLSQETSCTYWGCESLSIVPERELRYTREKFMSLVVIRVGNLGESLRAFRLIQARFSHMWGGEFTGDSTRELFRFNTCCAQDFFEAFFTSKKKDSDVVFGDRDVLDAVLKLYADYLSLGGPSFTVV